jgi:hypothetical protein
VDPGAIPDKSIPRECLGGSILTEFNPWRPPLRQTGDRYGSGTDLPEGGHLPFVPTCGMLLMAQFALCGIAVAWPPFWRP